MYRQVTAISNSKKVLKQAIFGGTKGSCKQDSKQQPGLRGTPLVLSDLRMLICCLYLKDSLGVFKNCITFSFPQKFNMHRNHLKIWSKADSDSIDIEWQLRFCISIIISDHVMPMLLARRPHFIQRINLTYPSVSCSENCYGGIWNYLLLTYFSLLSGLVFLLGCSYDSLFIFEI